ncbi:hypothetical protein MMC11_009026 [Xylographa trunciseda]|nr:hypothetical protein [Xylographa trunciseda]
MSTTPPPVNGLPLRRNGKPQSCEPCRKAKAACGHELPICQRCRRRNIAAQCTYHPAPLTRLPTAPVEGARVQKKAGSATGTSATGHHGQNPHGVSNLLFLVNQRVQDSENIRVSSSEFLGPTSFTAMFRDNQANIGEDLLMEQPDDEISSDINKEQDQWWKSERLSLGIGILKQFPEKELCWRLISRHMSSCDVELHIPSMKYCMQSIWSTYGEFLDEPRSQESLTTMAQTILCNELVPMPVCRSTGEWLESFTGSRLRWEIIGTFFAMFGLAVMSMPDLNGNSLIKGYETVRDRRKYARKMNECAEACLILCDDSSAVNEYVIWLMHHIHMLTTYYSGDASRQLWRRHGALAGAITSLGLHRGSDATNSPSVMVAELRKLIFAAAFIQDKQLATFTGRPPALSRRYSVCQLPVDLTDMELMADDEELKVIMDTKLDAAGWRKDAIVTQGTTLRAWMIMAIIRDEILELSLGPDIGSSYMHRDDVKRRSEQAYANLPAHLRLMSEDPMFLQLSSDMLILRVNLSLEFLLNRFLLERLPDDGSQQNKQDMLNTAKEMLDKIIILSANRDRLHEHQVGFSWAIVYFGIPTAGVLAVELLKQSKYPHLYPLTLPRSEVIQNLSIFIGCLGSIRPTQGNYTLCVRMRKVIRRILDQVLEPVSTFDAQLTPSSMEAEPQFVPDIDISSVMGPTDDPDFAEWLNSVDWTKGPWVTSY